MAFSWNPFARNRKQETQEPSPNNHHNNPNFSAFNSVNNSIERAVAQHSVINNAMFQQQQMTMNSMYQTIIEGNVLALPMATNKQERIQQYRAMAKYTETQWCLDEIADDFIHEDEHGNIINLHLPDNKENINEVRKEILLNEFRKYIGLFNLRDEGYNLIKRFLVEGELAWENVINKDYLSKGIIGVKFLPAEYYETLVDNRTNRPVGLMFDTKKFEFDISQILSNNYSGSAQIFNAISPTYAGMQMNIKDCIPMFWPQLTYIHSGEYSYEGYVTYPMIEKAKQAYYQLTLLQDAAVILRVTRAPERLLFNVSTGGMAQPYADDYVRNFANSLKAKKVATPDGHDIASTYNPMTKLENYIFAKADGHEGTTVESVTSTASYDQMEDIKYFLKRYVKQFKVPFSRFEQPENAKPADDQIPQEEFSFLQQEVRLQRRFAAGFKQGFITHLKLREIWDKYELVESDINVEFVRPTLYDLYNNQKIVETKMNTYKAIIDNEEFSKISAMKKILGMSDADINDNFKNLIREKQLVQLADYWSAKLNSEGPIGEWNSSPIPIKGISDETEQQMTADGDSEKSNDDSEESDDDDSSNSEESAPPEKPDDPEQKEASKPTFGLA